MGKNLRDWDWVDKRELTSAETQCFIDECQRRLGAQDERDCFSPAYRVVRVQHLNGMWTVGGEERVIAKGAGREITQRYKGIDPAAKPQDEEDNHHEEGEQGMNLTTAALIAQEDITTCQVVLEPEFVPAYVREHLEDAGVKPERAEPSRPSDNQQYDYILHRSTQASVGDVVLVQAKDTVKSAIVVSIDREPRLDPAKSTRLKWVLGKPTGIEAVLEAQHKTKRLAEKLEERRRTDIRSQVLQSFGVESAAELLEDQGPVDEPRAERPAPIDTEDREC